MTTNSLTIKLTTLTPLWTGGADGKSDSGLHITGIMGSLRWWYEVLVRGVGGSACDPSKPGCIYNSEEPPYYGLCDVCRLFGATGWARRFRLIVIDGTELRPESPSNLKITAARSYKDPKTGQTKIPTWYLKSAPLRGQMSIKLIMTDQQFQIEIIGGLIQFMANWAAIGAKPQMGFGIIDVTPHQEAHHLINHLQTIAGASSYHNVPTLRNMFFASIKANKSSLEENFNLKYDLRRLFATNNDLRHFLMGEAPQNGDRQGAKIMMSRPHANNTIRIWGWIPEVVTKFGSTRAQVIQQVHNHLTAHYTINYWREFNSTLDTVQQKYVGPKEFLTSLLKEEGK